MLDSIQSKAGLIGYYEGTLKTTLRYLESTPAKDRSWETKHAIEMLKKVLAEGEEIWLRVRGGE
jgi:hypothetical protein